MDSKAIVRSLRKSYVDTQKANPQTVADGQWMTKYLRNKFVFFGLKKPLRVSADKPVLERHKAQLQDRTVLLQLLPLLWEQDEREFQHFGGEVARKYRQELLGETEMEFNEAIDCAYHLITTRSWWDTIDMLAINSECTFLEGSGCHCRSITWNFSGAGLFKEKVNLLVFGCVNILNM